MSQYGSTFAPAATTVAAAAITRNPDPMSMTPMANLAGAEGFSLRAASAIQAHAKNGAKMKMKNELSD